jgi:sortase A
MHEGLPNSVRKSTTLGDQQRRPYAGRTYIGEVRRRVRFKTVAIAIAVAGVLGILVGTAVNAIPRLLSGSPAAADEPAVSTGTPTATATVPSGATASAAATSIPTTVEAPSANAMTIDIPAIDVKALTVVPYDGSPDDEQGTALNDRGLAANPLGVSGGRSPGEIGNVIVTGHRTAAGAPFLRVPQLRPGDHVLVGWADHTYDYQITGQLWITFHDPASFALQVAPIPGHPGDQPTQSMITLSTCATPEDNAAGHRERDAMGNPPHRIDAVGVLVAVT